MHVKTLSAIVLTILLAATASSRAAPQEKEPPKGPDKIGDKTMLEWVKIATTDIDPALRQNALIVLRSFPHADIRKAPGVTKALVSRMTAIESDTGVRIVLFDTIAAVGIDDAQDLKEAVRNYASIANASPGIFRLHSIQALGQFGTKAHSTITEITGNGVPQDPSYEVRQSLARTLGQIASNDTKGPNPHAIKVLSNLVADKSLPVRLEALEALFILGPPYSEDKKPESKSPPIDDTAAKVTIKYLKSRIAATKTTAALETNKQAEMWCRLVIVKFGFSEDLDEQLKGMAAHLSDSESAVRFQALELIGILGPLAAPVKDLIIDKLKDPEPQVRSAALFALGRIGEKMESKGFDAICERIFDKNEEMKVRIDALAALGMLGEKAEKAQKLIMTFIVEDGQNLKSAEGVALLQQALITLGQMGVKAKPITDDLQKLQGRVIQEKIARLNSPEYKKMIESPLFKKHLASLKPEERKRVLENQAEDELYKFIDKALNYIHESAPGRPGPDPKKAASVADR